MLSPNLPILSNPLGPAQETRSGVPPCLAGNKMADNQLSIADYAAFVLVLSISAIIGIYYAFKQRRSTTDELLLAGRKMTVLPVVLSLTASFMSAITFLGAPAEFYVFTTIYFWYITAFIFALPIAAYVYVPIYHNLKLTSVFEYIQLRFGTTLRMACVMIYIIQVVLFTGIVLYAPSLALEAVSGLDVWVSVFTIGIVCTFYTAIGGMRAVLWTDTFQIMVMAIGLIAVLVQGTIDNNGFHNIWNDMKERGKVEWWNFDTDLTVRHTTWGIILGNNMVWLPLFGTSQATIQRTLSLPTAKKAQFAYLACIPVLIVLQIVCSLCGMVCFSYYKDCDPLTTKRITSRDQILPLYVMERLSYLKGIPGLFVACIFSATLSTVSSNLNSLAAVTLDDIIRPYCCGKISESRGPLITKSVSTLYGALCIGVTFVAATSRGVMQASLSLLGMTGGPQLAVFTLGILFPFVNEIGAFVGYFTGLIIIFWIGFGTQFHKQYIPINPSPPPMSIAGCSVSNDSFYNSIFHNVTTTTTQASEFSTSSVNTFDGTKVLSIYKMSYTWYGPVAMSIVLVVGITVSLIVDCVRKSSRRTKQDPRLFFPLLSNMMPCLPSRMKDFLSCYVDYDSQDDDAAETEKSVSGSEKLKFDDHELEYLNKVEEEKHSTEDNEIAFL